MYVSHTRIHERKNKIPLRNSILVHQTQTKITSQSGSRTDNKIKKHICTNIEKQRKCPSKSSWMDVSGFVGLLFYTVCFMFTLFDLDLSWPRKGMWRQWPKGEISRPNNIFIAHWFHVLCFAVAVDVVTHFIVRCKSLPTKWYNYWKLAEFPMNNFERPLRSMFIFWYSWLLATKCVHVTFD